MDTRHECADEAASRPGHAYMQGRTSKHNLVLNAEMKEAWGRTLDQDDDDDHDQTHVTKPVKMHIHSNEKCISEKNGSGYIGGFSNNRLVQREQDGAMYDSQVPNHKTQDPNNNGVQKMSCTRKSVSKFVADDDEVPDKFTSPVRRRLSFDDMAT
jgi:hypothetical protein